MLARPQGLKQVIGFGLKHIVGDCGTSIRGGVTMSISGIGGCTFRGVTWIKTRLMLKGNKNLTNF